MSNIKNRLGFNFYDIFIYAFCGIFSLLCFYPLWFVLIGSITPVDISLRQSLILFLPEHITFEYFAAIIRGSLFTNSLLISFLKTSITSVGSLILTSMTAYGVSKKHVKGMKVANFVMVSLMFFTGGLIPSYLLYLKLSLIRTLWVMILPNMIAIGYFIIMRNYFEYSVSSEVEDAAIIDGANEFIMFFRIIIPLSTPMLAAILLFEAVGNWNDWTSYLYFVGKAELMPFVVVLQEILKNPNGYVSAQAASEGFVSAKPVPPAGLVKATIVVAMLPIMCVYPFLQKHFAKGIMVGAVKG